MGTTGENARQQVLRLAQDGLVEAKTTKKGVGRPQQIWDLTPAGHATFPDAHADVTLSLIGHIRDLFGQQGLDQVIAKRQQDHLALYRAELLEHVSIEARLTALAARRTLEGYMAHWTPAETTGDYLFIENHCPICAAAQACQGFCRSELEIFQTVLGPDLIVTREDHLLQGARRCSYRIRPR